MPEHSPSQNTLRGRLRCVPLRPRGPPEPSAAARAGWPRGVRGDQSTDTEELRPLRRALQEGSGVMKIILTIKKPHPSLPWVCAPPRWGSKVSSAGGPMPPEVGLHQGHPELPRCGRSSPTALPKSPALPPPFLQTSHPSFANFPPVFPTHAQIPPKALLGRRLLLPDTRASLRGGGTDKLTPLRRSGDEKR